MFMNPTSCRKAFLRGRPGEELLQGLLIAIWGKRYPKTFFRIPRRMKVLMHICCSNCSIYPLQKLLLQDMDIKGLWFNPNIHPYTEYINRRESLQKLQKLWNFDVEYSDDYALDDFLSLVVGKGRERCESCYRDRKS